MIKKLTLKNFKSWKKCDDVEIAPVTMLLGTNSSGKSTLIQALLLLKQTAASPDRSIHLNLGGDEINDYFNFGNFDDVLTQSAKERKFEIAFEFERPPIPTAMPKPARPLVESGSLRVSYVKTSAGAATVDEFRIADANKRFSVVRREKGAFSLFVDNEEQTRGKSRAFAPERSIALSAEAIQHLGSDGGSAEDISLAIRRELEGISYLGPLRRKPERDYVWNKSQPGTLGVDGSNVMTALLASSLLKNKGEDSEHIVDEVSNWLKRMGIAEKLELRPLGRSSRYELVIHKDGVAANLRDVGIGVSQVLPVLTLAYFAPRGATILLEEPEIHLHPLAQAVLADFFVAVSKKRGVQFIVETHSEHLFRRLQTLVAKNTTTPDQCKMYFVERYRSEAKLRPLEIDKYGRVLNWPSKFFGDALGETKEQARLMFERQRAEKEV